MYSFFIYFFIKLANVFQKHPFFFFLTTFKALIAWSYQLPQPGAPKSLRMILPWAVCGVKKYDLPKSESVTEAEMEPRWGHSGVLLMVLLSTFFSVAMPHSDLFCCVNVLKKWKVGVWAVEKFARKHLKLCLLAYIGPEKWSSLMPFHSQLRCTEDTSLIIWLTPILQAIFLLCAAVLLFEISAAFCYNEWLNYNGATNSSELRAMIFNAMFENIGGKKKPPPTPTSPFVSFSFRFTDNTQITNVSHTEFNWKKIKSHLVMSCIVLECEDRQCHRLHAFVALHLYSLTALH